MTIKKKGVAASASTKEAVLLPATSASTTGHAPMNLPQTTGGKAAQLTLKDLDFKISLVVKSLDDLDNRVRANDAFITSNDQLLVEATKSIEESAAVGEKTVESFKAGVASVNKTVAQMEERDKSLIVAMDAVQSIGNDYKYYNGMAAVMALLSIAASVVSVYVLVSKITG